MKKLMRYRITAGRAVEVRDVLMETRGGTPRGARRGKSSAKQLKRNEDEAVLILARQLNANCKGGDLFLTLKYSDSRLPATREEAKRIARNFMRRLARAYRKTTGKKLKWWLVTASVSTKTGQPVRLHHHVVTDAMDWELIAQHWPPEEFSYRRLDATGDYTAVARYMIRNEPGPTLRVSGSPNIPRPSLWPERARCGCRRRPAWLSGRSGRTGKPGFPRLTYAG